MEKGAISNPIDLFDNLPGGSFSHGDKLEPVGNQEKEKDPEEEIRTPMDFMGDDDEEEEPEEVDDDIIGFIKEDPEEEDPDEDVEEGKSLSENKEEDPDDDEDVNLAYVQAKAYKEDGVLPEDWEIPKDLTGKQLQSKLYDAVESSFSPEEFLKKKGLSKEAIEVSNYISSGMDYRMANEVFRLRSLSDIDLDEHPEHAATIMKFGFLRKEVDPETITSIIETKVQNGDDLSEAKRFQGEFGSIANELEEVQEQKIVDNSKQRDEYKNDFLKSAKTQKFGKTVLPKSEQERLIDYTYNNTEFMEVNDKNGKRKVPATGLQKKMQEIYSNPDEFVKFANFVRMYGDDFNELKNKARVEAASSTLDAFNKKATREKGKVRKKKKEVDISGANFIGEFSF